MKNIIKLLVLVVFQTTFSQSEIYLTTGNTEVHLQNAINNSNIGTIHVRTNILINSNIAIPSNKVLTFSANNKLIITSGSLTFQNAYINAGKYQIIKGTKFSGKLTNDIVYPEWFGAKVDDIIDDSESIQNAINIANSSVNFIKGKYLISKPIDVENCTLNLNGAVLKFVLDSRKECLKLKNNSSVYNGVIENYGTNANGSGHYQSPIIIGEYGSGEGYHNIVMDNLKIITNRKNGNGIMVTGKSSEIAIRNINFPDSDNLGRPILIHWGGADLTVDDPKGKRIPKNGTFHPYNVTINNIKIGKMTQNSNPDNAGIFISGAYNIKVTNVLAEEIKGEGGLISVYAGDFGNSHVADSELKDVIMSNIFFENCGVKKTHKRLAKVDCVRGKDDFGNKDYAINNTPLSNEILQGPTFINVWGYANSNNTIHGIGVSNSSGTLIKNCTVDGFQYGLVPDRNVHNLIVDGGKFVNNLYRGISISNGAVPPTDCIIKNVNIYHNGKTASSSGIYVGNSIRTRIVNNIIGNEGETQKWGIKVDSNAKNAIIDNNTVKFSLESGIYINNATNSRILKNTIGAEQNETQKWGIRINNNSKDNIIENNFVNSAIYSAFSIGSSTTYQVVYRFKGNSASNNVGIFHSGVSPMILDTKIIENTNQQIREFIGRAIPTNGYWNKGDKVYNNFISSSYSNGWICIKSGNGEFAKWKPLY